MKINIDVDANFFCPDDCPYADIEQSFLYADKFEDHLITCGYKSICMYAVDAYVKFRIENWNDTENGDVERRNYENHGGV